MNKLLNSKIGKSIGWILFSTYIYAVYYLLLTPSILDFSLLGTLGVIAVLALAIYIIPKQKRKPLIVYTILFLLVGKAIYNIQSTWYDWKLFLAIIPMYIVLIVLLKGYGKLSKGPIIIFVVMSLLISLLFPRSIFPIYNHFTVYWKSDRLYAGNTIEYFPLELIDFDDDGKMEIVTFGNIEEFEPNEDPTYMIDPEPLYPYVFDFEDGEIKRMVVEGELLDKVYRSLPDDYPGFPYFVMADEELTPLVQRQDLIEGMMQIGTIPFRTMALNLQNLAIQLSQSNGVLDEKEKLANSENFSNLIIKDGILQGEYKLQPFEFETDATKIYDSVLFPDGSEGLLLLGNSLQIVTFAENGQPTVSHRLTNEQLKDITTAEIIVKDLENNGDTELLVSFPSESETPATILRPLTNGEWQYVWQADNTIFRFEDVETSSVTSSPVNVIVLDKSELSSYNLRYLAGYKFKEDKMSRDWKTFISLINVRSGDLFGTGEDVLVALEYKNHTVYILKPHHLPVVPILVVVTCLLMAFGIIRRVQNAKKMG